MSFCNVQKISSLLIVFGLLISFNYGIFETDSVSAGTSKGSDDAKVKVVKVNDAQFKVVPNKFAEGKVKNGKATILNKKTKRSEELPSEVTTKDKRKAYVTYKVLDGNIIGNVTLKESDDIVTYKTNWKKCALGTGSGLLGGTGGGIASGAGYGAIGATPVSVGTGSVIGGVIGGVSGGMGGAVASCFD
ncbi:hypothetical protein [Staphylococcus coagulans]|uniref:hypothetical protein n=1 Tax=Staphylococcus coagulans TaxID=74706 RepID=UPI00067A0EFD|nr:hypothetical protein [Staphylococcus coagulans]AKS67234.1 hypothetical protein LH95_07125 [Staphylococcus schleiferi]MBA8773602.1 hypothetical protein [Staphylococcus coagulans]